MKQRELDLLRFRKLERQELELPFSFLSDGESIILYRHPTGEPMLYTDGRSFYQHGTGHALFYLSFDGTTLHRYGDGAATYWADQNFLYSYTDPPGHGPALYFDATGQQAQRAEYEKKEQERERLVHELQAFDERAARRSIEQQEKQLASPYRGLLRRLLDLLQEKSNAA